MSNIKKDRKTGIEAHGTKGMNNTKWRKIFKDVDALNKWTDDNDAEVDGQRNVYLDTKEPVNESKLMILIKKIIKEELDAPNLKKKKVSIKYNQISKRAYTTQETGIQFELIINNKKAIGYWKPQIRYAVDGVYVDHLYIDSIKRFEIFEYGTSFTRITAELEKNPKQPKDLHFTGPYLLVDNLKQVFITKIQQALDNTTNNMKLSEKFLQYFEL